MSQLKTFILPSPMHWSMDAYGETLPLSKRTLSRSLWPLPSVQHCRSTALRCHACQRRFHSQGNLANHQQLYQH
ncbi:hypothetical protein BDF14DRAFT_1835302 [Spinellus fusiger]|nr:hypothetical protein BDF14DRAFT_1835302 [Spinellus fusiger]